MRNTILSGLIAFSALGSTNAFALTGIPLSTQGLYYEIGGGDIIREPLAKATPLAAVGMGADLNVGGLSCDAWEGLHLDLDAYADMVEDHLTQQIESLQRQIVESMIGLAQGYATAALQRALPGMYDWSMNVRAQLDVAVELAQSSCESVLADINSNVDPLADWKRSSLGYDWALDLGAGVERQTGVANDGPTTVIRARRENSQNIGATSLPWFGDNVSSGGEGEEAIEVVKDSVIAGYVQQVDGADLANGAQESEGEITRNSLTSIIPTAGDTRLPVLWDNAEDAAEWVASVVGEETVSFCETCASTTTAGTGLPAKVHEEKNRLIDLWRGYLAGDLSALDLGELALVSSTKTILTQDVMIALSRVTPQDRGMLITRLISDVAVNNVIEQAFAARTMLRSSLTTSEIQGNEAAKETILAKLDLLRREIDEVMFEVETNRKLLSDVPSGILALHEARKAIAAERPRLSPGVIDKSSLEGNVVRD